MPIHHALSDARVPSVAVNQRAWAQQRRWRLECVPRRLDQVLPGDAGLTPVSNRF